MMSNVRHELVCAYCEEPAEGNYGIHRDGLGEGPELDLCDACGSGEYPTLQEIWEVTSALTEDEQIIADIIE